MAVLYEKVPKVFTVVYKNDHFLFIFDVFAIIIW